jgi:hypothetical protein
VNRNIRNTPFFFVIIVVVLGLSVIACGTQTEPQPTATPTASQPTETIIPSETATAVPSNTATLQPTATSTGEPPSQLPKITHSLPTITSAPTTPSLSTMTEPPPIPEISFLGVEIAGETDLEAAEKLGTFWVRRNGVLWHEIEPIEGQLDWDVLSGLDTELKTLSENNREVILVVRGTPDWAQRIPGYYCGPIEKDKLEDYGDFISELVARYSVPPYNVKYWELGNEPDVNPEAVLPDMMFGCWGDPDDEYYGGGYYAEMLKVIYPVIKEADPEAQVLLGGLLLDCDPDDPPETQPGSGEYRECKSSRYLEGVLENRGGDYFDGVSFHAYDYYFNTLGHYGNGNWRSSWRSTGPLLIKKVNFIRDLLGEYGYTDKFLVNSEVSVLCGSTGKEDFCKSGDFQNTKANYVPQAYSAAKAEGLFANVWYSMQGWRNSGLVKKDGDPYPAYKALKFAVEQFDDVKFIGDITSYPELMGYEFERGGGYFWVIWAMDDKNHTVILPDQPTAIFDSIGTELPAEKTLTVTLEPLYIEWIP